MIENEDQKSKDYSAIKDLFRPAHADYTYQQKYGVRDYRGGGRSSARETAMRVAAGAIAKKYLSGEPRHQNPWVIWRRWVLIHIRDFDWDFVDQNPFFCPDAACVDDMAALIDQLRRDGDSVGARINIVAEGVMAWARRAGV